MCLMISVFVKLCLLSVPVCVCVSNWAVLRVWRALESMLVGHQATKPSSQRASEQPPWWGGRQPPCHLVSLPSCPPPPPLHRAPLSPGWNVPPRRGAPRDVCLTTNKGFRLGAQVRETCAFLGAFLPRWVANVSTSCFYEESHLGGQGTNPNNTCTGHPAFTMLSTGFGYRLLVPRCFLLLPPYKPARHQLTRRTQGLERTEGVCKSIQQLVLCTGSNFLLFPLIRPNRTH